MIEEFFLRVIRKIYSIACPKKQVQKKELKFDFQGQEASDYIKAKLQNDTPCMIARLGNVEMHTVVPYYLRKGNSYFSLMGKYAKKEIGPFWWDKDSRNTLSINAGFFPINDKLYKDFSELILNDIQEIDILGSWTLQYEKDLNTLLEQSVKVPMKDLEPYYHQYPWSNILKGKKVLVIYPFKKSIEFQYQIKDKLFEDKNILPDFELIVLQSIQSISGNKPAGFDTWFDALDYMKKQIEEIDFDIAIIGAGAYGLPLAAHVKRLGKKAIQLGGATQILFGIKGERWKEHPIISKLFNEYWISPLPEEKPKGVEKVEDGCYW